MKSYQEKIVAQLRKQNIELNPGATVAEIVNAEEPLKFIFPDSFKAFYQNYNGFKYDQMDQSFIYLWPIETILLNYIQEDEFIGFCDFMVNSHSIGFLKNRPGIFKNYT